MYIVWNNTHKSTLFYVSISLLCCYVGLTDTILHHILTYKQPKILMLTSKSFGLFGHPGKWYQSVNDTQERPLMLQAVLDQLALGPSGPHASGSKLHIIYWTCSFAVLKCHTQLGNARVKCNIYISIYWTLMKRLYRGKHGVRASVRRAYIWQGIQKNRRTNKVSKSEVFNVYYIDLWGRKMKRTER